MSRKLSAEMEVQFAELLLNDDACSTDSNLQHARHAFEGYRAFILNRDALSPYAKDSARDRSWLNGNAVARGDVILLATLMRAQFREKRRKEVYDGA